MKTTKMKKLLGLLLMIGLLSTMGFFGFTGCSPKATTEPTEATTEAAGALTVAATEATTEAPKPEASTLTLVTTTSTENSGLLDALLPTFEAAFNCKVKVVAVGSGAAFEMAKAGDADVIMVHAPADEEKFMTEGFGRVRTPLMYNDFVVVGPKAPAGFEALKIKDKSDIIGALTTIQKDGLTFLSRGDDSGTHKKELKLWKKAGLTPSGDKYMSTGKGMGEVLTMADELLAYTLTDRATYLSMKDKLALDVLVEGTDDLYNPYAVITLSKDKFATLNHDMADAFSEWLMTDETQKTIANFGVEKYGQPLFYLLGD